MGELFWEGKEELTELTLAEIERALLDDSLADLATEFKQETFGDIQDRMLEELAGPETAPQYMGRPPELDEIDQAIHEAGAESITGEPAAHSREQLRLSDEMPIIKPGQRESIPDPLVFGGQPETALIEEGINDGDPELLETLLGGNEHEGFRESLQERGHEWPPKPLGMDDIGGEPTMTAPRNRPAG
ncbi:hypothetical protein AAU61_17080 [Desulfocarbo indianensis]|nr:hypothetical protein AAU61_17080 [Desulfocarbo indianensis]